VIIRNDETHRSEELLNHFFGLPGRCHFGSLRKLVKWGWLKMTLRFRFAKRSPTSQ
jgi:hypothetical protein